MNLEKEICKALCGGYRLRKLSMGYAIRTPYQWISGDKIVFYARIEGQKIRFEDDGGSYAELEGMGVDMSATTRLATLDELLKSFDFDFDQDEFLFHSKWIDEDQAAQSAVQFAAFLNRLQDFLFVTRDRVENTFKDDLVAALDERFGASVTITERDAATEKMRDYTVDIVVRDKQGRAAAIFPVVNEQKALEAILFSKELELKKIDNIVPFLIYQDGGTRKINRRTKSRALNSELNLADWEGSHSEVIDKVEKHLRQSA